MPNPEEDHNDANQPFDAERIERENREFLSSAGEQARLREAHATAHLVEALGTTPGYVVPWAVEVDTEGKYWMHKGTAALISPQGTATLRVERQQDGMHASGEVGSGDISVLNEVTEDYVEIHGDFTVKPEEEPKRGLGAIRQKLAEVFKPS